MPLFFSLVLIAGMVLGFNLRDTLRNKRDIGTVLQRNDRLEEIIDLINDKYADTVDRDALYQDAISGILKDLDPHTVYFPAEDVDNINDELEGGFSGIGVEFSIIRDTIEVTSVVDNGPAHHAGVTVGDQLIKVGDSIVAGNNITAERISNLLRGKQKSSVNITLKLASNGSFRELPVTRDIIPTYSVEASIMLDSVTGFIKINRFTATTFTEFTTALTKLKGAGAKQLVLDLRDNPGGYLDAATNIADDFLDDHKLIVYTEGVHSAKAEYKGGENNLFETGRLAVLMDEGSASASEILAGAIQDWDRGIIVGRRSFGKGLVQEQYEMPDGAALRLTIARYYTPSGRCIQRSFSKGREAYEEDYEKRFETGELTGKDTDEVADTVPFYTADHRVVFGGGGIKPDVYVPYDTTHISASMVNMIFSQELKTAIWDYFRSHQAQLKYKSIGDFNHSFTGENDIISGYLAMLHPEARIRIAKQLGNPVSREYLDVQIKAQVARFLFHDNGYYAVSLRNDEVVSKARAILKTDEYTRLLKPVGRD
jgi:carboxyl-terminal processing protease